MTFKVIIMKQNVHITKYTIRRFIRSTRLRLISISTYSKQHWVFFGKSAGESADFDIGEPHFEMMKQTVASRKNCSLRRPYSYLAIGTFFKGVCRCWLVFDLCRSCLSIQAFA